MGKRKNILAFVLTSVCSFSLMASVNAATMKDLVDWGVAEKVSDTENTYKLKNNAQQDIEIGKTEKETIILDLNGKTLTNSGGNYCKTCSAIQVFANGELTITDSSDDHKGTISYSSDTEADTDHYNPIINNHGTLTVQGGTIEVNKGDATNHGVGIYNDGTLSVEGGEIKTTVTGSWGLTNEGTATLKGGTFTQGSDFSIINNAKDMTIEDGTFTATDGNHNALITNKNAEGTASLKVTGGDFDKNTYVFYEAKSEDEKTGTVDVLGGSFPEESNVENFLNSEYVTDSEGNVVEKADYSKLNELLAQYAELDKDKYTEESYEVFATALAKALELDQKLTAEEQEEVDNVVKELEDAIAGLNEVAEVLPDIKPDNTPDNNANTSDSVLLYVIVTIAGLGLLALTTKKVLNK